ncbi:OmpA family protein [Rheinheimera sp. 4Y26]|uniref:OmpA family protein n=1 Tax=Rheinheimera sp. 4Y26 TaxID=2977811 RepID=UPI0021B12B1F|nr:OmpA family protein [Rheinheimera sp. 4Y26]MCT6699764.1 OmpA family protein [Rheinheimera sp. 4Y26]
MIMVIHFPARLKSGLFSKSASGYLLLLSVLVAASATADEQAHPLFGAYPRADVERYQRQDYGQFQLPNSAVNDKGEFGKISATGEVTRHEYEIEQVSSLQLAENYLQAIQSAGFSLVFSCEGQACGPEHGQALGDHLSMNDDVYNYYRQPYYLLAKKDLPDGPVYAAWYIGAYNDDCRVQQVIVQGKTLKTDLIQVNTAVLSSQPEAAVSVSAEDAAKDHPMLSRYPGAKLDNSQKVDTEKFTVLMPQAQALELQGDLQRHTYDIQQVSTLKVFENYQHALKKAGFSQLALCQPGDCGGDEQMEKLGDALSLQNDVYNFHRNPYYLVHKLSAGGQDHYVALYIGAYNDNVRVQQLVLSSKTVATDLVKADASELKRQLDTSGKALIYGVYFDTGKAEIKTASTAALKEIALLLQQNSSLKLYVVGHTDDTGDAAANQQLSEQRAAAVVQALQQQHQIAANRLQAKGVGPYAPASNNTSVAGKELNRRVELVQRL